MSTVIPTAGETGEPIVNKDQLLAYFKSGEKPRSAFRVGTEHEKFGFTRDKRPLPFDGEDGIEAILNDIAQREDWRAVQEHGRTIALFKDGASITLEPGGQLELSGAPLKTIHETCQEVGEHLSLMRSVCATRGVGFIGIGFHPTATWDEMPEVPKSRYQIMRKFMPTVGARGLDMMKRTCTVQANFDYESEADMVSTMQTALAISPVVTAIFANGPFKEGKPTGFISERASVWADTDPARAGFPQLILDDDFGYERYLDYVLDVPMYFIRRDGHHLDYAGASFRKFMDEGIDGHRANMSDFADHLTTVFPEVRLKTYLEVRGADCGPWSRICALPALWKGILYDHRARDAARALFADVTGPELRALHRQVAEFGFRAKFRGDDVLDYAQKLYEISAAGLDRLGDDEVDFIEPVKDMVTRGETSSDTLLRLYTDEWNGDVGHIYDEIEFWKKT